jgi:cell division protein FtsN
MAKAQTNRGPTARKRDRHQGTGAFWFLLGTLVGAFGVGLAWMQQERAPAPAGPTEPVARTPVPKPTFDFYKNLPQEEVLVPVEEPQVRASPIPLPKPEPATPKPASQPEPARLPTNMPTPVAPEPPKAVPKPVAPPKPAPSASSYRLQIGSFRNAEDAERRKAELALQGISVDIHQAKVGGADTFRLRTGRFDKAAADALSRKLEAQGVSTMPIKAK